MHTSEWQGCWPLCGLSPLRVGVCPLSCALCRAAVTFPCLSPVPDKKKLQGRVVCFSEQVDIREGRQLGPWWQNLLYGLRVGEAENGQTKSSSTTPPLQTCRSQSPKGPTTWLNSTPSWRPSAETNAHGGSSHSFKVQHVFPYTQRVSAQ